MTGEGQVSAGWVYDLGHRVGWCPKCRPVLTGRVSIRCEELLRVKGGERGWPMVALDIMPGHVHLFVTAHLSDSPSRVANQFKGLTSRWLRAGFPHLCSRLLTLWSRSCFAVTAGAVLAERVRRGIGTQDERPWRKGRAR